MANQRRSRNCIFIEDGRVWKEGRREFELPCVSSVLVIRTTPTYRQDVPENLNYECWEMLNSAILKVRTSKLGKLRTRVKVSEPRVWTFSLVWTQTLVLFLCCVCRLLLNMKLYLCHLLTTINSFDRALMIIWWLIHAHFSVILFDPSSIV